VVTDVENRGTLGVVDYCPPVLVVSEGEQLRPGDGDFTTELMSQSANFVPVARDGGDPFILLVGGRGGQMRPVLPELSSLLEILTSIQLGLEPDEADTGWDVADPAWSFGLYYSVIRPLLSGDAATAHESDRVPSAAPSVWAPADELPWMDDAEELEDVLLAA
jgi:acetyl-CoA synthetase